MNSDTFNPQEFLDELILEMKLNGHEKEQEIKEAMAQSLHDSIFKAVSLNIEDDVINEVLEEFKDENDPVALVRLLIARSPMSQIAIFGAIESFKTEILDTHKHLKSC